MEACTADINSLVKGQQLDLETNFNVKRFKEEFSFHPHGVRVELPIDGNRDTCVDTCITVTGRHKKVEEYIRDIRRQILSRPPSRSTGFLTRWGPKVKVEVAKQALNWMSENPDLITENPAAQSQTASCEIEWPSGTRFFNKLYPPNVVHELLKSKLVQYSSIQLDRTWGSNWFVVFRGQNDQTKEAETVCQQELRKLKDEEHLAIRNIAFTEREFRYLTFDRCKVLKWSDENKFGQQIAFFK